MFGLNVKELSLIMSNSSQIKAQYLREQVFDLTLLRFNIDPGARSVLLSRVDLSAPMSKSEIENLALIQIDLFGN